MNNLMIKTLNCCHHVSCFKNYSSFLQQIVPKVKSLQSFNIFKRTVYSDRVNLQTPQKENTDDTDSINKYDIIINGGGIVGFSFAVALCTSPYLKQKNLLLLEQEKSPAKKAPQVLVQGERIFSNRVSSITKSSKQFFQKLGIWDEISNLAKPIRLMQVWSHSFDNGITFTPNDENTVCYVVENQYIMKALRQKLYLLSENCVRYGTVATDIVAENNLIKVSANCNENNTSSSMLAKLLIGCDGFNSLVRSKSNFKYFEHDLEQVGIVGTVEMSSIDNFENDIAFQRFASSDFVIAILPLSNTYSSFVISAKKSSADTLLSLSDEEFVDVMNKLLSDEAVESSQPAIINELEKIARNFSTQQNQDVPKPEILSIVPQSRAAFPLKFGTTLPFMISSPLGSNVNKVALIGDAAHRVHPLAGQGLNLGLGDAQVLSECLHNELSCGEDPFADDNLLTQTLFDFERLRQTKVIPMMAAIHSMQTLFNYAPSPALRVFDNLSFIKKQIVKFANSV